MPVIIAESMFSGATYCHEVLIFDEIFSRVNPHFITLDPMLFFACLLLCFEKIFYLN